MKAKIEEVGIHFSKRRSSTDKYRFMNRLVSQLKESKIPMQMLQEKSPGEARAIIWLRENRKKADGSSWLPTIPDQRC